MRASFALIALVVSSILPNATLAQSDEAVFWQSISSSSDGAEFCAYLEAFPNGKFVALAKLRAKKLGVSCGESQASPTPAAPKPTPTPAPTRTAKPKPAQPAPKVHDSPFAMTGMKGWLETPENIFKAFRLNEGGVALKWTGGYCTMIQGANTAKPINDLERANTAYDLFDSQGNIGVWTARPKHETGLVPANICIKFAAWSEYNCQRIKMDGQKFDLYGAMLTSDLEWSGIILPASQYKQCQEKSYDEIATELRRGRLATSATSVPVEPEIEPLDQIMYVQKAANVRAEPSTNGAKLFVMNKGEQVQVTGKVRGDNWYQIKLGGSDRGYIFGTLLGDQQPGGVPTTATASAPAPSTTSATKVDDEWSLFELKVEMFPASQWTGRDDAGCDLTLSFEHWKADPKYSWARDCNGQTESETLVYALSPGAAWLNLPEDALLFELCRLFGNDQGHVKLTGCKYAGVYKNANRADQIIDAVAEYKAGAPEREAEAKRREAENKRLKEEAAQKTAVQAKTSYGKRLAQLQGKPFGTAPIPAGGQGIVVCSSNIFSDPEKSSGQIPEGSLMNFNASRMQQMETELSNYGITDFTLAKLPWLERNAYALFDVFNGVIFYDRNIQRRTHPTGGGDIVVGEMINTSLKEYIFDAPKRVQCEVMLERKTCADPKDPKGNFSMPCD